MLECTATLKGIAPLQFGRPIQSKKETGEGHDAFEERTWRERLHVNQDGHVFIPPMALKNCLTACAKHLSETVPGKGKATYTKHFKAGILVPEPIELTNGNGKPILGESVKPNKLFVPADGVAGSGKRVFKFFPTVYEWMAKVKFMALDPILMDNPGKIEEYLSFAGQFIGMLGFRPANNGYFGRWVVDKFSSKKVA